MNIETLLISRHKSQFDSLITFLKSLIIKNTVEGDANETSDTLDAYEKYERAYVRQDPVSSYALNEVDMLEYGFTSIKAKKYALFPEDFQSQIYAGNQMCIDYLNKLRAKRVRDYVENNIYYRQFCGLPQNEDEFIQVENNDTDVTPEEFLYLHKVTMAKYPKTYSRLFYDREVEVIYKKYNYMYLKFLENPMTPYEIRNKEQYDICYFENGLLTDSELQYWYECYDKARTEICSIDYIDVFETQYNGYVNLMLLFILSYAFNLYCGKMLEKYAVRDFTDQEVYDILDSNSLGKLKVLSMPVLRRIVNNLPDLQQYTGTDKVFDIIFDIVADKSLTIKRLYLTKKYNTDTAGNVIIDKNELYDKNVELVFNEKTILKGNDIQSSIDQEIPYEDVVLDDDTWGNTSDISDKEIKREIKDKVKKEIMKSNFSTICTKYVTLSKVINVTKKMIDINNKLGLLYQYLDKKDDKLSNDKIIFDGIETTPLSVYAAWNIAFACMNGCSNPDRIPVDSSIIEGIMKLRTTDRLNADIAHVKNLVVDLGKGNFKETFTLSNFHSQARYVEDIVEELSWEIERRHPLFSHYSLKKNKLDHISYKIKPINAYPFPEDEEIAYDNRRYLKRIRTVTETDFDGNVRKTVITTHYGLNSNNDETDVTVSEGFDEERIVNTEVNIENFDNENYRHVYKYSDAISSYLNAQSFLEIEKALEPTYVYNIANVDEGTYAYDAHNLSLLKRITTRTDSSGNKRIETEFYKYTLESSLPVLLEGNTIYEVVGNFDDEDTNIKIDIKEETDANLSKGKIYVFDNGSWKEATTAWVEIPLIVNDEEKLMLLSGKTYPLYAVFTYANKVGDYLSDEEIAKNLVRFDNVANMSIEELYDQYDDNYAIIEAIKDKISKTYSFSEYNLWDTIYKANLAYHTTNNLFKGATNYSEYIASVSNEMYDHVENLLNAAKTPSDFKELCDKFYESYSSYIREISKNNASIILNDIDVAGGEDIGALEVLFNQFISIYTQLYKSDYHITYDNENENSLVLLYDNIRSSLKDNAYTILELVGRTIKDHTSVKTVEDYLILEEFITDNVRVVYEDSLILEDEFFKCVYYAIYDEFLELSDINYKDVYKTKNNESLGLSYECLGDKTT